MNRKNKTLSAVYSITSKEENYPAWHTVTVSSVMTGLKHILKKVIFIGNFLIP